MRNLAALVVALGLVGQAQAQAAQAGTASAQPLVHQPGISAPSTAELQTESLPDLLRRVLQHDPQVRAAQAAVNIATERRVQARSRLGPSVGLNAYRGRAAEVEFGASVDRRTDRAEAVLRWNLYNSGADLRESRAAEIEERAAEHELHRAAEDVAQRLAEAYLEALRLQELLTPSAERLASIEGLLQRVVQQQEAGKLSDADLQSARVSLLDARLLDQELSADHQAARRRLSALAGDDLAQGLGPLQPLRLRAEQAGDAADSVPGAVSAARERALAAEQRVQPVTSLFSPRIDLELQKQLSERTTPSNTTENRQRWMVTARWDFPVGGELQSRRREGQARAQAARAEADRISLTVNAEKAAIAPKLDQAGRLQAQLAEQVSLHDSLVQAGELQHAAGRRSLAQLIQLRESRFFAQQRLAEHKAKSMRLRVASLALGGNLLEALGVPRAARASSTAASSEPDPWSPEPQAP